VHESDRNGYKNADDMFDERLYDDKAETSVPTLEVLRAFVTKVFKEAEVGEEVIVMAYVYLTRLTQMSSIRLAASNWKLLILSCFMLASKGWSREAWKHSILFCSKRLFCLQFGKRKLFGMRIS
jgi:hypothetical protein